MKLARTIYGILAGLVAIALFVTLEIDRADSGIPRSLAAVLAIVAGLLWPIMVYLSLQVIHPF